jgi:glycosyltransferase involved in cell wall biosynthesis
MKIAILSTVPSVPPTAGNRSRINAFVRGLRKLGSEVYFIYLPSTLTDAPDEAAHVEAFGHGRYISLDQKSIFSPVFRLKRLGWKLKRRLFGLFRSSQGFYFGLDEYFPAPLSAELKRLQAIHGFDAVVCEYLLHSASLEAFPSNVLKILDTHDSFSDRHKLFSRRNYWFSVPPSEQVRGFRRADVVIAIQEEEGRLFRAQIGSETPPVEVVSHLLDASRPVTDFTPADAIFVGSGNTANIAAVSYFTGSVLPLIRRQLPAFQLVLAGSICRELPDEEGVVKLGIVEHLADAYARAPLSVNPMLAGTGINIKLLDALAAGVPTVSTLTGVRGLGEAYRNGVVVVADDDPQAFADAVVALAGSQDARRQKGQAAHRDALAWNTAQMSVLGRILERT